MNYLWQHFDKLITASLQHLYLVLIALICAIIIAFIIILLSLNKKKWMQRLIYFFSALYAIPSYATYVLLIPLTGLGTTSAIIALTLYSEYILLRHISTGINEIDPTIIEAAEAMGMTSYQIFFKVQLPLASRSIFNGVKLTLTTMINTAMIAATINAGGLGSILFDGLRMQDITIIFWGAFFSVILCLLTTAAINSLEKWTNHRMGLQS